VMYRSLSQNIPDRDGRVDELFVTHSYRPVSPQFASFHSREPGWMGVTVVISLDAEA